MRSLCKDGEKASVLRMSIHNAIVLLATSIQIDAILSMSIRFAKISFAAFMRWDW